MKVDMHTDYSNTGPASIATIYDLATNNDSDRLGGSTSTITFLLWWYTPSSYLQVYM